MAVILPHGKTADDVGMVEQGSTTGLTVESVDIGLVGGHVVRQDLDGDVAAQAGMVAEVDRTHAALAEQAQNPILAETAQVVQRIGR